MTLSTLKTSSPPPSELRVPSRLRIHCEEGCVRFEAATPVEGEKPPLRRFHMTAYTGGAMQLVGWRYPVVVDLTGLRVSKKPRPILKDHDARQIVGYTDEITVGDRTLEVSGTVSGAGSVAQEVIATSENGFPWQASLGATAEKVVFIAEGRSATANGREFSGPIYIARKSVLGEVSFVALGADDDTFAHVAAGSSHEGNVEVITMDFQQWALESGFQIEQMDEKQVSSLSALYHRQQPATATAPPKNEAEEQIKQLRAQVAAESRRIEAVRKICAGQHPKIEAEAIEEGWDETKTELAMLRASRPTAPTSRPVRPRRRRPMCCRPPSARRASCPTSTNASETRYCRRRTTVSTAASVCRNGCSRPPGPTATMAARSSRICGECWKRRS